MPIAASPDQKFGFKIVNLALWVASKRPLDQFCRGFFSSWKSTRPTGSAKITEVHRETMKRGWGGFFLVWEVWGSVEHTIKTKVGCFSHNNLGLKGGQEKFYNLSITAIIVWAKSWLRGHI